MKFKQIKLNELFEITSGGTPSRKNNSYYKNGDIPWVKTGDLKNMYLTKAGEFITELGLKESSAKLFPRGTVLIAMYGATIGNCSILNIDAASNQACAAFKPTKEVLPEFLYFFLTSIKKRLISLGVGGAQSNISLGILKDIEMPLVSIDEQKRIVMILNRSIELINKRKAQIEALDQLTQSLFLGMFGDPCTNPKGWDVRTFRDVSTVRQGLQIPIARRLKHKVENSYRYITVQYLHGHKQEEYIQNPKSNFICSKDDILMTRTGNTGMVISNVEGVFHNNFFLIDFNRELLEKSFLIFYLNNEYIQWDLLRRAGNSTIPDLNHSEFYKISVYVPPLNLQHLFANKIKQIEHQKQILKSGLSEFENMYNVLLQRAFKKELFTQEKLPSAK